MRRNSKLETTKFEPVYLDLQPGRLSQYSRELADWWLGRVRVRENDLRKRLGLPLTDKGDKLIANIAGAASFSDYLEAKVLDYIFNDPSTAFISADVWLGLWTNTLTDASTGSTVGEAAYTGYGRTDIPPTSMSAAVSGAGTKTNSAALTLAACTGGSATITFYGTFDASTVGNMLIWGTCTSTTVDTSHTPPTVPTGQLAISLD